MLHQNRFALKEWAVVVRALTAGRQIVLLRKGGIEDEGGRFRVEHPEFFLYPTFEHQHRKFVRPEHLADFDRAIREQPAADGLIISAYAVVTDCEVVSGLDTLRALSPDHVWNDDYLQMRFNYKPELPLYALLLRAFKVPAVEVPYRPEYRGCKSWVKLDRELTTAGREPALTEDEFTKRGDATKRLLGSPRTTAPSQSVGSGIE
jgi:hypothetical protein